jgi:hypothetical protein
VVHIVSAYERTDTEIAQAASIALTWNAIVPNDRVTVTAAPIGRVLPRKAVHPDTWNKIPTRLAVPRG